MSPRMGSSRARRQRGRRRRRRRGRPACAARRAPGADARHRRPMTTHAPMPPRPPCASPGSAAAVGPLGQTLRRFFRACEADEADAATFRAGQLPVVLRLTPMALAVNVANAVMLCSVWWAQVAHFTLLALALVIRTFAALGLRGWWRTTRRALQPHSVNAAGAAHGAVENRKAGQSERVVSAPKADRCGSGATKGHATPPGNICWRPAQIVIDAPRRLPGNRRGEACGPRPEPTAQPRRWATRSAVVPVVATGAAGGGLVGPENMREVF